MSLFVFSIYMYSRVCLSEFSFYVKLLLKKLSRTYTRTCRFLYVSMQPLVIPYIFNFNFSLARKVKHLVCMNY